MADRVEKPGQKLGVGTFIEEVRLTPASLRDPRSGHGEGAAPIGAMKIHHPDTDSLTMHLREGSEGVVGEIMGEDLNENVVVHRDGASTLYEIEVYGDASRVSPRPGKKAKLFRNVTARIEPSPRAKDLPK